MKRKKAIATFLHKLLFELPFSSYFLKAQIKCLVAIRFGCVAQRAGIIYKPWSLSMQTLSYK